MTFADVVRWAVLGLVFPCVILLVLAFRRLKDDRRKKAGWITTALVVAVVMSSSTDLIFGRKSLAAEVATVAVIVLAATADVWLASLFVRQASERRGKV